MRNSSRVITATPSCVTSRNQVFRPQKLLQLTIPAILVNAGEIPRKTTKTQNLTAIVSPYRSFCVEAITIGKHTEANDFAEVVICGLSLRLGSIPKRLQHFVSSKDLQ
jgi:hypothetical protein